MPSNKKRKAEDDIGACRASSLDKAKTIICAVSEMHNNHMRVLEEKNAEIARLKKENARLEEQMLDITRGHCIVCGIKNEIIDSYNGIGERFASLAKISKLELSQYDPRVSSESDTDIIGPSQEAKEMRTINALEIKADNGRYKCLYCDKSYTARHVIYSHLMKIHQIQVTRTGGTSKSAEYRKRAREVRELQGVAGRRYDRDRVDCENESDISEDEYDILPVASPATDDFEDNSQIDDWDNLFDQNETDNITPNYIIHFSEEHKVTTEELYLFLLLYADKNCLTQKATCGLFAVANVFFPHEDTLNTEIHEIEKVVGYSQKNIKEHYYCAKCNSPKQGKMDNCSTDRCNSNSSKYFVTYPFAEQLRNILDVNMWIKVRENKMSTREDGIYADILDGDLYKKLSAQGGFLSPQNNNISMSVFIDGMRLFKSSRQSLWTVYMLINEMPLKERFKRKHLIQWGVWQGSSKPNFKHLLEVLREDAERLYKEGIELDIGGRKICVKILMLLFIADLPGRAYILDMTFFNGRYGCLYCYVKGADGLATKSFDYSARILQRTPIEALRDAVAATPNNRIYGFKGFSPLHKFPEFTIFSVPIESMHGAFLGITKTLIELWFFKRKCSTYIGQFLDKIDAILVTLTPPHCVHRSPRPIAMYKHWKANELRNFLFYYSLPLLKGYLDEQVYMHYAKFVDGVYLLNQEKITCDDLDRAEVLMTEFVSLFHHFYRYPKNRIPMTLNIHNALHYAQSVRNWGNLFNYTAFPYESFSGEISRKISGTGVVLKSMYFTHFVHQKGGRLAETGEKPIKDLLSKIANSVPLKVLIDLDSVLLLGVGLEATQEDEDIIQARGVYVEHRQLVRITKILKEKIYLDSEMCMGIRKKCTHYILVADNEHDVQLVNVHHYIYDTVDKKVYAICRPVYIEDSLIPDCALHIAKIYVNENEPYIAFDVDLLLRPVFLIKIQGNMYAAKMPNKIDHD